MQGVKTDRGLLHDYLWETKDRNDVVKVNQQYLSDELDISSFTLSHLLKKMVNEGRLERLGNSRFMVKDPVSWRLESSKMDTLF